MTKSKFKNIGTIVHGIDPAPNIVMKAIKNGIDTECDFFNSVTINIFNLQKVGILV